MADPTAYTPDYDFSDYESSNPATPKPGDKLDIEFQNVQISVGELVDAVKDVRRSDGALKNGVVTPDSLSEGLRAIIGSSDDLTVVAANIAEIIAVAAIDTEVSAVAAIDTELTALYANLSAVQNAEANAQLAAAYAEEDEDVEVTSGQYSAKHWAAKALENANDHFHEVADLSDASANAKSLLQAADYAAMKTALSVVQNTIGATSTSGAGDWNDATNTIAGFAPELLRGDDANGPGSIKYFHAWNIHYSGGQITQIAIPYSSAIDVSAWLYRGRYAGTWSKWRAVGDSLNARNRVSNACMQVSQELGSTAQTVSGKFFADQWEVQFSTSAGAVSYQRAVKTSLAGAANVARISVTTADVSLAATEHLIMIQKFEGLRMADLQWGTASAKPLVLRFAGSMPQQKFCISIRNADKTKSYVVEVDPSAANTAEVFAITIPGCTSGTWPTDETRWGELVFSFAAGSTYQTTADTWQSGNFLGTAAMANGLASNTNVFEIADVGLKIDLLGFGIYGDFEVPDYTRELEDCMRYWQITRAFFWGDVTSAASYRAYGIFSVTPRTNAGIISGTHVTASGFPTTIGAVAAAGPNSVTDFRTASSTMSGGYFYTDLTLNARL